MTVIDLDRAGPSDPSKDVAEFLCRFRIEANKEVVKRRLRTDLATAGAQIFVEASTRATDLRLSSLLYYWSATLLSLMLDSVLKRHLDEDIRRARLTYFESEFTDLPDLIADLGHPA